MSSLSDETLLADMASGDEDAAATFVCRHQGRVYGLAFTILGSRELAEEAAQEAFIRAWRHADAYDIRKARVRTWLLTITRNLAIDAVRARRERPVDPGELTSIAVPGDAAEREAEFEASYHLRDALRSLPAEQTRAVVLSAYYAMTAREIAELEHVPLGTAKTRLRRGLARMREVLAGAADYLGLDATLAVGIRGVAAGRSAGARRKRADPGGPGVRCASALVPEVALFHDEPVGIKPQQ